MAEPSGLNRVVIVVFGAVWSWCVGSVGLLAMTAWPTRFGLPAAPMVGFGAALVAVACFLFAATVADRVFTRAHPRVTGAVEIATWAVATLGVIAGVALWIG